MSQIDKLIDRLYLLPTDMRIEEIDKVMRYFGYWMKPPTGGGSHYKFVKPGCEPIVIPVHGYIKKPYLEQVKKMIGEERKNERKDK